MNSNFTRREFLGSAALAAAGATLVPSALASALKAPASRVAIGLCRNTTARSPTSSPPCSTSSADSSKLVNGKTVAIKLNMTGAPNMTSSTDAQSRCPLGSSRRSSARSSPCSARPERTRVRLLESAPSGTKPLEDFMIAAGWQPKDFASAANRVEFENTNFLGSGKTYARFMVPGGGLMYAGYDLNHSYRDTDVFVSLAKLKEHRTAGVTLSMKNCFGITPCTIYSEQAPVDEPEHRSRGLPRAHAHRLPRAAQERAAAGRHATPKTPAFASRASPPTWSPRAPSISPSSTASTP